MIDSCLTYNKSRVSIVRSIKYAKINYPIFFRILQFGSSMQIFHLFERTCNHYILSLLHKKTKVEIQGFNTELTEKAQAIPKMLSKIKAVFILVVASGINEVVKLIYIKTKNVTVFTHTRRTICFNFCPIMVLIN